MVYRVFSLPVHNPGAAETQLKGFSRAIGCCRSIAGLLMGASGRSGCSALTSSTPRHARRPRARQQVPGSAP
jgi:hypothetical protein